MCGQERRASRLSHSLPTAHLHVYSQIASFYAIMMVEKGLNDQKQAKSPIFFKEILEMINA